MLSSLSSAVSLARSLFVTVASAQGGPDGIKLLEPIGGKTTIQTGGGPLGAFGDYVGAFYPWMLGMAAAIAVLMGLYGGIEIMQAGADSGAYDKGKNRLLMSLGGLLLVLLSATLLKTINPTFFK